MWLNKAQAALNKPACMEAGDGTRTHPSPWMMCCAVWLIWYLTFIYLADHLDDIKEMAQIVPIISPTWFYKGHICTHDMNLLLYYYCSQVVFPYFILEAFPTELFRGIIWGLWVKVLQNSVWINLSDLPFTLFQNISNMLCRQGCDS